MASKTSASIKSCATCRQRKIKCDLTLPACLKCQQAGWTCPGFPAPQDGTIFQHETAATLKSFQLYRSSPNRSRTRDRDGAIIRLIHDLPTPLEDRAVAFLVHNYTFNVAPGIENHAHLPLLLQRSASGSLVKIVAMATGLAALANTGNCPIWRSHAYSLYGKAVQQLRLDLGQSCIRNRDEILASILLLATFEAITRGTLNSINTLSHHIFAAAQLVHKRQYAQFSNDPDLSSSLAIQLRGAIVMICHELQEPIPTVIDTWSYQAGSSIPGYDMAMKGLGNIEKQLIIARADIKSSANPPLSTILRMLLPLDEMLEAWRGSIPSAWAFKSYKRLPSAGIQAGTPLPQYDVYPDLYIAVIWNAYRSYRLLIHETITSSFSKCESVGNMAQSHLSINVLQQMTDGICQSALYFLSPKEDHHRLSLLLGGSDKWQSGEWSPTGALLLFWPLFSCGMLVTTSGEQRHWIACVLRNIRMQLGMELPLSMAKAVESFNSPSGAPSGAKAG